MRIETGSLYTPSGEQYNGFKVTIGEITDPSTIQRTYEDIESILGKDNVKYSIHEEHRPDGKFKSYSIST